MKSITHEGARILLQTAADQELQITQRESLDLHLSVCEECRVYAKGLTELQDVLQKTLQKRWNVSLQPLSIKEIAHSAINAKPSHQSLTIARRFVAVPIIITMLFTILITSGVWYFQIDEISPTPPLATAALMMPIPSAKMMTTRLITLESECDFLIYEAQPNDTVDSIAQKFSISRKTLMDYNNMTAADVLPPYAQLRIPQCSPTPSATPQTPARTTTITASAKIPLRTP